MSKKDQSKNPFFNTDATDDIDQEITNYLTRPTLVDQWEEGVKTAKKERDGRKTTFDFGNEIRQYWWLYLFLGVSGLFTLTLGVYMGISPTLNTETNMIVYQTDIPHLLLALVYAIAFVTVTEGAAAIFKWLMHIREEGNDTQFYTTLFGMLVAFLSVAGTGIAGGMVIASNISFLTKFVEIPEKAQTWVVIAIPLLIAFYTVLGTVYSLSSRRVAAERLTAQSKTKRDLDHKTRMDALMLIGREKLQAAELQLFQRLVLSGSITSSQANYAMQNNLSVVDLERMLQKDLTGDGKIEKPFTPEERKNLSPAPQPQRSQGNNQDPT